MKVDQTFIDFALGLRSNTRPFDPGNALRSGRFGTRQASFDTAGLASLLRMKFLYLN